ncbi:MAG: hypothetical protein GVY02_06770 [Bacteroidetes bacterium]|jgi:putative flippase GtrA|nr:hypothetical protein [Bacteroidota bacterium]
MKREVSYLVIGCASGIALAVAFAFLFESPWIGYTAALFIGLVVLFMTDRRIVSNLKQKSHRLVTRTLFAVLAILQVILLIQNFQQAEWQKENLGFIQHQMHEMLALSETHDLLVKSLRYHVEATGSEESSLESAFRAVAGDRLSDDGSLRSVYGGNENPLNYRVEIAESDSILIHVEKSGDLSENGSFSQVAILTSNGVRYE